MKLKIESLSFVDTLLKKHLRVVHSQSLKIYINNKGRGWNYFVLVILEQVIHLPVAEFGEGSDLTCFRNNWSSDSRKGLVWISFRVIQNFNHSRPYVPIGLQAQKSQLCYWGCHFPNLGIWIKPQGWIDQLVKCTFCDLVYSKVSQINFLAIPVHIHRWYWLNELNKDHPEAIDITFTSQLVTFWYFGSI